MSIHLNLTNIMYEGIMVTTPGIIIVARYSRNTPSLPRHLMRLKAYAAIELVNTCSVVMPIARKTLLKYHRPTFSRGSTL